ncbi:hypothetical protein K505DRAFT_395685, partial [Melanomma pulvis-pyrius CBS 109.77]
MALVNCPGEHVNQASRHRRAPADCQTVANGVDNRCNSAPIAASLGGTRFRNRVRPSAASTLESSRRPAQKVTTAPCTSHTHTSPSSPVCEARAPPAHHCRTLLSASLLLTPSGGKPLGLEDSAGRAASSLMKRLAAVVCRGLAIPSRPRFRIPRRQKRLSWRMASQTVGFPLARFAVSPVGPPLPQPRCWCVGGGKGGSQQRVNAHIHDADGPIGPSQVDQRP